MGTIVGIACLCIIIFLIIYIIGVSGIDKVESKYRSEASTIDTYLWDIQHRLKKAAAVLEKYSIDTSEIKDPQELGLGMPSTMQIMKFSEYCRKMENLKAVDRTTVTDEADRAELDKYDAELEALRVEVITNSVKHNKAVNAYNSKIARFPYSFVARRKGKSSKGIFTYVMPEKND